MEQSDTSLRERIATGKRAKAIIEDPVFREAIETLRLNCFAAFESAPLTDQEGIMGIRYLLKAVNSLEDEITAVMQTGQLSEQELSYRESIGEDE